MQNGVILLCGLFFYDVFWVFCTPVMVSVAKNFDAPIKLLFPKSLEQTEFSMLGLGDIVIPGIMVAILLRYDLANNNGKVKYFTSGFVGYVIGIASTIVVMNVFKAAQPARKAARRDQINENQQRRQQVDEDRVVREAHRVMRRQVYRTQCMRNAEPADTFSRRVNSARADSFAQYCRVLEAVEMATVISMAAELEAAAGGAISAADAEVFSSPKEYFQFLARRQFCQDSNKAMYDASNAALKLADGKYREAALDVKSAKDESGKRRLEYDTPGGPRALFVAEELVDQQRIVRYRRRQEVHRLLRATRAVRVDGVNLSSVSASGSIRLDVNDIVLPGEDALTQRSMYTDSASDVEEDHDLGIVKLTHQKIAQQQARRRDQARKDAALDASFQQFSAGGGRCWSRRGRRCSASGGERQCSDVGRGRAVFSEPLRAGYR